MSEWWEERTLIQKIGVIIGFAIIGIGLLFLLGLVVMWLWNWLMPDIFGLPRVSYWQAWGLLALSQILFKGFGSGSDNSDKKRERKRKKKLREYMSQEDAEVEAGRDDVAGGASQTGAAGSGTESGDADTAAAAGTERNEDRGGSGDGGPEEPHR